MWILFAVLSALFAALTSVLAKIGIEGVNSTLATAIRTVVVLILAWGMVIVTGAAQGMQAISKRSLVFLVLSGLATGLSWLCYYRAIQLDGVSRVAPIDKLSIVPTLIFAVVFLGERLSLKVAIGYALIAAGTLIAVL